MLSIAIFVRIMFSHQEIDLFTVVRMEIYYQLVAKLSASYSFFSTYKPVFGVGCWCLL